MATITTEYGKLSSNKTRTVYLRIRSGKTEKRIKTQIKVLESEISPRTKRIKDFSKARQMEMLRLDWEIKINQLGIEALGVKVGCSRHHFCHQWKIQSELTPRANVSLTPENFLILTP